jgi:hypothetical protein
VGDDRINPQRPLALSVTSRLTEVIAAKNESTVNFCGGACVNSFDKKGGTSDDRRKITDRRKQELAWANERRLRPDRRLNNISVEWIPFDEISIHPLTRDAFCSTRTKGKKAGWLRGKDPLENESARHTRCDKKRSPIKSWGPNIFKRTQRLDVEQRTIADRRTKDIDVPYDRRVRPDRRLNNLSLEWITFE